MSAKIDLFTAAPSLMKDYQRSMVTLTAAAGPLTAELASVPSSAPQHIPVLLPSGRHGPYIPLGAHPGRPQDPRPLHRNAI